MTTQEEREKRWNERQAPTSMKYGNGESVPLWHALDILACDWRYGWYRGIQRLPPPAIRKGTGVDPEGTSKRYEAQLAGYEAGVQEVGELERRASSWAEEKFKGRLL